MNGRQANLENTISSGEELVEQQHFASEDIRNRINEVRQEWTHLSDLAEKRRTKLKEAEDLYQVSHQHVENLSSIPDSSKSLLIFIPIVLGKYGSLRLIMLPSD